jgi:hypothetical protein
MTNSFTTVTQTGFLSRIGNSIAGLFIGPILIIGAIWLLSWNEGRAVQAIVGIGEAGKAVVEATGGAVNPANETKLVHVSAPAQATDAIKDDDMNLSFDDQVAVDRKAEMYQWKETKSETTHDNAGGSQTKTTTYKYDKVWSSDPIDSSSFKEKDGHENPEMKIKSKSFTASDAKVGDFNLDSDTAGLLTLTDALKPTAPDGWTADGSTLNNGDKADPKVGDERITYTGLAKGATVSVLARQTNGGFSPYTTTNGFKIDLATVGNQPASAMLADKKKSEGVMTWLLRAGGFVLMLVGFMLFLGPLSVFASFLPFMGGLVRGAAFLAAFVVSIPLSLVVIALSWIAFRPIVGIGLLVAAGVVGGVLWFFHRKRPMPAAAPAAAA